jgi:hypothetical protein
MSVGTKKSQEKLKSDQSVLYSTEFRTDYSSVTVSQGSVVGIVIAYGLDDRGVGVRVLVKSRIFSSHRLRPALGPTQARVQWVPGALSLGVKRPGREVDYSPPTSAEVKKKWIYISIHSPIRLHGVVLN